MTNSTADTFRSTHLLGGTFPASRLGYGTMQLAGPGVIGWPEDVNAAIALVRRAVELGVQFFDTANAYGPRTVNRLIGRALSPFGADVVIGNKVGATRGPAGEWLVDGRPETIRTQVEEALTDMRADVSLLTYLRLWGDDPGRAGSAVEEVPLEESLGVLVDLRNEGKLRLIGISGASAEMLERAQQVTPIAAVQNRFNLLDRSGVEVLGACERDGIAFVPYFPLATGSLADADVLKAPSERLGISPTTTALAWLLRRSPVIIPIPGTKSPAHLEDNHRALSVAPELTSGEVNALTAAEDEKAATLATMSDQMRDALKRGVAADRGPLPDRGRHP